jgi:rhodanese-related sulfurtransferase
MLYLTATVVPPNAVLLEWTTLTETNNYGFEVQKSTASPNNYQTIPNSFIPGNGTTNEPHSYSYTDLTATAGVWYYRLKQIELHGTSHYSDGVRVNTLTDVKEYEIPTVFSLSQNHPNPFNPTTTITYGLPVAADVTLIVYNSLGQKVAQLADGRMNAGYHNVVFDASQFASGMYICRMQAGTFAATKKLILLK